MKPYPIALTFSDFHTAKWKQFNDKNQRTLQGHSIISELIKACNKYNVNHLLFPGDWNDHPKHMDNEVMQVLTASKVELEDNGIIIVGIDGNHDFSGVNSIEKNLRGFFSHLSILSPHQFIAVNFNYYDTGTVVPIRIHGIPYINGNSDYELAVEGCIKNLRKGSKNILMIHRDLPGAVEPNGISIGDMDDDKSLKKLFKKFDLVLSGHIHKPQWIEKLGKNVLMVGATNQQRRSDAGTKMGYWIIYSDMSTKFINLKQPEFKYYKEGEPIDDYHYWIKLPPEPVINSTDPTEQKFNSRQNRDTLVKSYMKVKGVKSKSKLNLLRKLIND